MGPPIDGMIKLKPNAIFYVVWYLLKVAFLPGVFISGYAYSHYDQMTIFEVEVRSE